MAKESLRKPLIVFGCGAMSGHLISCLNHDSDLVVEACTVNNSYMHNCTFEGYPVYPFEDLADQFAPQDYEIILPISNHKINGIRKERVEQAKAMGFSISSYISSKASIWPDAQLGKHMMIFEGALVQSYAQIGSNVIIRTGAILGHHVEVGDHSFIASGVVTGGRVRIGERCWLGLGAVIRDGVSIGDRCFIGMGAVVTADTRPDGVYVGVPARRIEGKTSLDIT